MSHRHRRRSISSNHHRCLPPTITSARWCATSKRYFYPGYGAATVVPWYIPSISSVWTCGPTWTGSVLQSTGKVLLADSLTRLSTEFIYKPAFYWPVSWRTPPFIKNWNFNKKLKFQQNPEIILTLLRNSKRNSKKNLREIAMRVVVLLVIVMLGTNLVIGAVNLPDLNIKPESF